MAPLTVAVVGGGTMGTMTLWALARRGVTCVGYERYAPGHAFGGAGGETRLFRSAYHEGAAYGPLLKAAESGWRALEAEMGVDLLAMTGGVMVGRPDSAFIRNVLDSVRTNALPHMVIDAAEMRTRYPQNVVEDDEVGVVDPGTGVLRAEYSVSMAAEAATRRGAELLTYTTVTGIDPGPFGVMVRCADGRSERYDRVVVAAGAWTNSLVRGIPWLDVQSIAVHWYPVRDPAAYAHGRYPVLCRDAGVTFCVWPSTDGATVKVGLAAGLEHLASAERLDQRMPVDLIPVIDDHVRRYLLGAIPHAVRHAVQVDAWTADHDFLIDRHPDDERIIVLAGFSGHGFKMSPAIGEAAADLAADGTSDLPIDRFALDRFSLNPTLR
jgi:sarcosine oxidase